MSWADVQLRFWKELHARVDRGECSPFDRLETLMADRVFFWLSERYEISERMCDVPASSNAVRF